MDHTEQTFDRMLSRAWAAMYDVLEVAENQQRYAAAKRLRWAAHVLTEVQGDLQATAQHAERAAAKQSSRSQAAGGPSAGRRGSRRSPPPPETSTRRS